MKRKLLHNMVKLARKDPVGPIRSIVNNVVERNLWYLLRDSKYQQTSKPILFKVFSKINET